MKELSKKSLCLVLALIMALSLLWPLPAYAQEENATSGQTEPLPGWDDLGAGDALSSGMVISVGEEDDLGAGAGPDVASAVNHGDGDPLESGTPVQGNPSPPCPQDDDTELQGANDETAGLSGVTISDVTPALIVMKEGESKTITITCAGVYRNCVIYYENTNASAFECTWGNWNGDKVTMRVKGVRAGSGRINITLRSPNGSTLASRGIPVEIQPKNKPTISLSTTSMTVNAGSHQSVVVTIKNPVDGYCNYSIWSPSVCEAQWGDWNGWSIPLTVTGKSAGSSTIVIEFRSGGTTLASATLTVKVPSAAAYISATPNPASVQVGKSLSIRVNTVGTVYDGDYLQWQSPTSAPFSASWSSGWDNKTCNLLVTGSRQGQATLTVRWKTSSGTTRASTEIPVSVIATPPNVLTAPSLLSLKEGEYFDVTCVGYNADNFYFQYDNQSPAVIDCAWVGTWFNGNSHKLRITAKQAGNGRVQVSMVKGSSKLAVGSISVTVTAPPAKSPSYQFQNYAQSYIPLSICERMFKSYWKAVLVYLQNIGAKGVCFGMASTSGLLVNPNSPTPGLFGRGNLNANLRLDDYSSYLKMTVKDFVAAMQITQAASSMYRYSGLSNMIGAVESGGIEKPVMIILPGHAVLAYRCQRSGNNATFTVYDSNRPLQELTLTVNPSNNSWSCTNGYSGTSANISYVPYDVYETVWRNRGNLNSDGSDPLEGMGDSYPELEDSGLLLMSADSGNFTVRKTNEDANGPGDIVARYVGGVLQDGHDEKVRDVSVCSDDGAELGVMLYVPPDYYYVKNDDAGDAPMTMQLAGAISMVEVTTAERQFEIAVSDEDGSANALFTPKEGEDYSVSVGSYRDGELLREPIQTVIEGAGHGEPICLGIDPSEGLYINNRLGAEDGLSLDNMGDANANDSVTQDFALTASLLESDFPITASASRGGTISPDGQTMVTPGGNQHYRIVPQDGYAFRALYVNGIEAAYAGDENAPENAPKYECLHGAYEYEFQNVRDIQTIHAEFAKDLQGCEIHIEKDGENPVVSVWDPDNGELQEGYDYVWSRMDGEEELFSISALDDGGYFGNVVRGYDTPLDENKILNAVYDREQNTLTVTLRHEDAVTVAALAYENTDDGAMLPYFDSKDVAKDDVTPVVFSLADAGLPQDFKVKLFMFNSLEKMRVLDAYTVSP